MKKAITFVLVLILALSLLTACGGKGSTAQGGNNTPDSAAADNNDASAAFAQFGLDVTKIKPNLGTPEEVSIQYGNAVDTTVYYRKAAWLEKSDVAIDVATGLAYNERIFDYIKSISADGKCYKNKTVSEEAVIDNYSDLSGGLVVTLSFKYDGMWIDVYFEFTGNTGFVGEEFAIGVTMNGSGSY
jgi:hypothetical protein